MFSHTDLYNFVKESNAIENINREPSAQEIDELKRFLELKKVNIEELVKFVSVYQPDAKLRDQYGLNVRIGKYIPPFGGPNIPKELQEILDSGIYNAFDVHVKYELLHPFTDGNGRSGRALWAWKSQDISRGFLFPFYMSTLQHFSVRKK